MTDQAFDILRYTGKNWVIAGVAGYGYFTPAAHDLIVTDGATFNWRGWVATFDVDTADNALRLSFATLFLDPARYDWNNPPCLFGVAWSAENAFLGVPYRFAPDKPLIAFTGGLLIDEVHEEWRPALHVAGIELPNHENVRELIFEDGLLIESYDRTELMNDFDAAINASKGRHKRVRELDDAAQNRLAFRYEDARFVRDE